MKKNLASITKGYLIPGMISLSIFCLPVHVVANGSTINGSSSPLIAKDGSYVPASAFAVAMLDPKFLKKFEKAFPSASGLKWYEDGRVTRLFFKDAGKTVRAVVRKNGDLESMISYYNAALLPDNIGDGIREEYKGYRLTQVTEVEYADRKAYLVQLEGIDDWLKVKWLDGDITLEERYEYSH